MLVKLVKCHSVQTYIEIHRVKIACISIISKLDHENCFCAEHNLTVSHYKLFQHGQCRDPVFSRTTAAKLNQSTSSNTTFVLFYNKKFP